MVLCIVLCTVLCMVLCIVLCIAMYSMSTVPFVTHLPGIHSRIWPIEVWPQENMLFLILSASGLLMGLTGMLVKALSAELLRFPIKCMIDVCCNLQLRK